MPASSGQVIPQPGVETASSLAAFWYAASTVPGIPEVLPIAGVPGGSGLPSVVPVMGISIWDFS